MADFRNPHPNPPVRRLGKYGLDPQFGRGQHLRQPANQCSLDTRCEYPQGHTGKCMRFDSGLWQITGRGYVELDK